jgi:hypothetical protein
MTNLRRAAEDHAYGLRTEPERTLNRLLNEYDHNLSLRRIPEGDPAFKPEMPLGVWEETSAAGTKWVFTLPETAPLAPGYVLARIAAGDNTKLTPAEKMRLWKDSHEAAELAKIRDREEEMAARREEMKFIASTGKSTIRHKINGEDLILSDEVRSVRRHV